MGSGVGPVNSAVMTDAGQHRGSGTDPICCEVLNAIVLSSGV